MLVRLPAYGVAVVNANPHFSVTARRVFGSLLALSVLVCAGCGDVRLFEQKRLNRPDMRFDADPLQQAMREHVHAAREGAVGGFSGEGAGGCGCN